MGNEVPKIPKNRSQSIVGQGRLRRVEFNKYYDEMGVAKPSAEEEQEEAEEEAAKQAAALAVVVAQKPRKASQKLLSQLSRRLSRKSMRNLSAAALDEDQASPSHRASSAKSSMSESKPISPPPPAAEDEDEPVVVVVVDDDLELEEVKEEPQPLTAVEEPQPVTAVEEPQPVVVEEPQPVAIEEPQPVTATEEPQPITVEEPQPVAVEEPQPIVAEEPRPVLVEEPQPVATEEPRPVATEEPQPVLAEEPVPVLAEEPQPVATEEPQPVATGEPQPVLAEEPKSVLAEEPQPVSTEEPQAAPTAEPQPTTIEKPQPVLAEEPLPATTRGEDAIQEQTFATNSAAPPAQTRKSSLRKFSDLARSTVRRLSSATAPPPPPASAQASSHLLPPRPPLPSSSVQQQLQEEDAFDANSALPPTTLDQRKTSSMPSDQPAPKKRFTFTPLKLPKCDYCGKDVEKLDLVKDGKEIVFHKNCLQCSQCHASLVRKERIVFNPNLTSAWHMTHSQYVEEDGKFFCNNHNPRQQVVRRSSIKTQDIAQKYVQEEDLIELGHARKETNQKAKSILEQSGGVTAEILCGRCGSSIETSQAISISGLERFHQICPSKEEIERSNKSLKYFLKRLPDHLAIQLQWDADRPTRTHTFLFLLDKDTWKRAHLSTGNTCAVEFFPDPEANDPIVRNFEVPATRGFDAKIKHYPAHFTFTNPKPGAREGGAPTYDEDTGELKITKYSLANGVFQTIVIYFIYNEFDPEDPIQSERVVLSFEKEVADADPLQAVRESNARRRSTMNSRQQLDGGGGIDMSALAKFEQECILEESEEGGEDVASALPTQQQPKPSMIQRPARRTTGLLMQMQVASALESAQASAQAKQEAAAAQVAAANAKHNQGPRRQTQSPAIQNFDGIRSRFNNANATGNNAVPSAFKPKN